eukprot:591577-Pleurochrysis_carterae.AAC.1
MATKANGNHSNGVHAKNGASYNGNGKHEVSPEKLTFGKLYSNQLTAQPPMGFAWFTVPDMLIRMSSAVIFFYRVLFTQPRRFALFAYKYNSLWCGFSYGRVEYADFQASRFLSQSAGFFTPFVRRSCLSSRAWSDFGLVADVGMASTSARSCSSSFRTGRLCWRSLRSGRAALGPLLSGFSVCKAQKYSMRIERLRTQLSCATAMPCAVGQTPEQDAQSVCQEGLEDRRPWPHLVRLT